MGVLSDLEPKRVFEYFERLTQIPRGSGDMQKIADFCMEFADRHGLRAIRDEADNIIIFKDATAGYEQAEPIILQGHLDMVCQKTADRDIDFLRDGLDIFIDNDFIKARGTTLGADNGVAVAMVLAILASDDIAHPAIEAVFTTDEEIGMVGALQLDTAPLRGRKMINLDSEDMDCMTVSCAGGSDFTAVMPIKRSQCDGTEVTVLIKGLRGGHSGVCIHEGRVNANMLAGRFLDFLNKATEFSLVSINGGNKGNAIPLECEIKALAKNGTEFLMLATAYFAELKTEISAREPQFEPEILMGELGTQSALADEDKNKIIYALLCAPNGVQDMSAEIAGLVETSLNLGILQTDESSVKMHFALRSNKKTAIRALEEKLYTFFGRLSADCTTGGHYPPWEFNPNSTLQKIYIDCYKKHFGAEPRVEAIHAGLEGGVFADKIGGYDGISIGPQMHDVHTTGERLSISSTAEIYKLLLEILAECK